MYFKIWISYNGLKYSGVGINNNENFITIRQIITNVFTKNNVEIQYLRFSSRTDAKVSAYLQNFVIITNIDITNIFYKISNQICFLTESNIILHSFEKLKSTDIKTHCLKTYVYKITNYRNAVTNNTHFYCAINNKQLEILKSWFECLSNKKINYQIFCKEFKHNNRPTTQCLSFQIKNINISTNISETYLYCTGNCFMYKQVRMIMGTLLKILKKHKIENIVDFVQNVNNKKYVYTAPGHALYLLW